jgi:membrane protein DedA with SNARE-associated domain
MQQLLDWLTSLPPAVLYLVLGGFAAVENFVPPVPADAVVAFGSFLAARAGHSPLPVLIAVLIGNLGGAFAMFALGRRFGAAWIHRRLHLKGGAAESRVQAMYGRWGIPALFISRFLPGVRAVVPPLAGALRIPAVGALFAIGTASTIWYGAITYLAYNAGTNWEQLSASIGRLGARTAMAAGGIVVLAVVAWLLRRRRA